MQYGAIASKRCSQVDFLSEGSGVFGSINREWKRQVQGRSCIWLDNKADVGIGSMKMTGNGCIRGRMRRACESGGYLANSRRDAVAWGAFLFCTRRMFLGGEDQSRDRRSLS